MLLVASNAGKHTPLDVPIVTFVHWHTVEVTQKPGSVQQFSQDKYQELLWHLLLRGHDGLFMWCPQTEAEIETRLVHRVYAASLQYREFLEHGESVTFDVPSQPGPVVSGLKLGSRLLLRRTDFDNRETAVRLRISGITVEVERVERECQIVSLSE